MPRFKIDFRLLDVRAELPPLREPVETQERQLEFLAAQRRKQVEADLPANPDEADVQLALQELAYEVEHTYPRVYRGALITTMWSVYESGILQVSEFLQRVKNARLGLMDLRGRGVLDRARRYFPGVLEFDLYRAPASAGVIQQLAIVRNAFAHANGRVLGLRPRAQKTVWAMEASGHLTVDLGYAIPSKQYLLSSLDLVEGELRDLVSRAIAWDDQQRVTPRIVVAP